MITGQISGVFNAISIWVIYVETPLGTFQQPVEPRYMCDIVRGEELEAPGDLVGREVEVLDDGMGIALP